MKIFTSPMSGVTDYAYRKILLRFHPDLVFTEMVNSKLLIEEDKETLSLLKVDYDDLPFTGVQVFGSDMNYIEKSFLKLEEMGFTNINLNMGCPQPKIIKSGYCSALLPRVNEIENMLEKVMNKKKNKTNISIKIRIGFKDFQNPELYFKIANRLRLHFICIHGRTQEQMYNGEANWDIIKSLGDLKRKTLLIGNGDLITAEDIENKLCYANVDGIMLARGMYGNPWLIKDARKIINSLNDNTIVKNNSKSNNKNCSVSINEIKQTILDQINFMLKDKGEVKTSMEINKFIKPYFSKIDPEKENINQEEIQFICKEIIIEKDLMTKIKKIEKIL